MYRFRYTQTPPARRRPTCRSRATASVWVRADAPGATVKLKLREYVEDTGAVLGQASSAITLTTSWQLLSVTYTPLAPGTSSLDYSVYVSNAAAGSTCFDADDAVARFEPGATASLSLTPTSGAAPVAVHAD